jgi:hypothetical protein
MLSVERSSSRSPPSSSPSSRPPKKPGAGGFGSAAPKKPLRVRQSRRGQEENREGHRSGSRDVGGAAGTRSGGHGATRAWRGDARRAGSDRGRESERRHAISVWKNPGARDDDRSDRRAGDPECAERGKRVDRARARTSRRTSGSSLVHSSRSGSRALAGLCAALRPARSAVPAVAARLSRIEGPDKQSAFGFNKFEFSYTREAETADEFSRCGRIAMRRNGIREQRERQPGRFGAGGPKEAL